MQALNCQRRRLIAWTSAGIGKISGNARFRRAKGQCAASPLKSGSRLHARYNPHAIDQRLADLLARVAIVASADTWAMLAKDGLKAILANSVRPIQRTIENDNGNGD
jgi:hypothetical protein